MSDEPTPAQQAAWRRRMQGEVVTPVVVTARNAREGDPCVLFGPGTQGEPTAQDWAEAIGTISYELITRVGDRVPRRYVGGEPAWHLA